MTEVWKEKKIVIVDDHPLVRDGLAMRISLQEGLSVCGQASSAEEALTLVSQDPPDLAIVDIALKDSHGIDLIKQLHASYPQVKVLVVSGFDESLYAERALRSGARGYLHKQETSDKLIDAIRTVLQGDFFLSQTMMQRFLMQIIGSSEKRSLESLSDRELEVFRKIGQGLSSGVIAGQLHLSTHTIDTHRENIKRKLGAKNAAELNRMAVQWVLENG
jgi:DNA-binding NarL/FixJ family response regulator